MCIFHLTSDHEGATCPKNVIHENIEAEKVAAKNVKIEEESSEGPDNSISYYLEY